MSKLEELLQEYCPDGVEYKNLGDIVRFINGRAYKQEELLDDGKYKVLRVGNFFTSDKWYYSDLELDPEKYCDEGDLLYAWAASLGPKIWDEGKTIFHYHIWKLEFDETVVLKGYLYHFLLMDVNRITNSITKSTMPHVSMANMKQREIPVPPLPVQCEIVRILDEYIEKVTKLNASLETELTARKKQYEYYKELLLNHSNYDTIPLSELFETKNGFTPPKSNKEFWTNGVIPWFRMEDIRENGRVLSDALQHVTLAAAKNKPFPANSIIISTSATIGEHALITTDFLSNQRFTCLTLKKQYKEQFNMKFLFYYCFKLGEFCRNNLNQGNFASVDMTRFNSFEFPVIPIVEQKKVVDVLEQFDRICNDISTGLPAEIAARQKQYEYYRDKLLTFKRKES